MPWEAYQVMPPSERLLATGHAYVLTGPASRNPLPLKWRCARHSQATCVAALVNAIYEVVRVDITFLPVTAQKVCFTL